MIFPKMSGFCSITPGPTDAGPAISPSASPLLPDLRLALLKLRSADKNYRGLSQMGISLDIFGNKFGE